MTEQNTTLATALHHVTTSLTTLLDLFHELEQYDSPDNDAQPTVARHTIVLQIAETVELFHMKQFQEFINTYSPEAMQELDPVEQKSTEEVVQKFQAYVREIAKREGRSTARDLTMSFPRVRNIVCWSRSFHRSRRFHRFPGRKMPSIRSGRNSRMTFTATSRSW